MVERYGYMSGWKAVMQKLDGEFVGYSDYAALKAENERLTNERDAAIERWAELWKELPERALSERAGAVKVETHGLVQALSRLAGNRCADGTSSVISAEDRGIIINVCHDLIVASKSALTTEPAVPEGRQEAVRGVVWFGYDENTGEFTGQSCAVKPYDSRGFRAYAPVTTRPAEQAVTDEMIEAAAEVIWNDRNARRGGAWRDRNRNEIAVIAILATARAALTAALTSEEGR